MILPAIARHKGQIIDLWNKAFGDKAEDIERYLKTILEYFLVYEEGGTVKGMLSVLPISFCGKNGGYVYAVTTLNEYRGQGICNRLMEYVKADKKYDFLVLKPQNESLIDFYKKMDFEKVPQFTKKEICVKEKEDYQLKKLSALDYEMARDVYFGEEIIKWDSKMLTFAKNMYGGEFYAVEENGRSIGIAFAYQDENMAVIKELLAEEHEKIANFIAYEMGCAKAEYMYRNLDGNEGFMTYPKDIKNSYFNIYFD